MENSNIALLVLTMAHGSLQYWPHRRAQRRLPRARANPKIKEQTMASLVAFKVGMTHLMMVDDSDSPSKNQEISRACTLLEVPRMEVYGIRLYGKDPLTHYKTTKTEVLNKSVAQKLNIKKIQHDESKLDSFKQRIGDYTDAAALVVAYPKDLKGAEQNHPVKFESAVGGNTVQEKFDFVTKFLGKEIKATDVFKPGEYVDVMAITKGKGWAGPIKRFGVKRNFHKATNKIRHGGPLGAFGSGKVFYSIPRAGQMGFNYRTEHNKRLLKLGAKADADKVNVSGGYLNYGLISNDYIVVDGSVGGPAKRMVRLRKSIRNRNLKGVKEPKIQYISK